MAQQSSDLTIAEYCQQNALSKTTFYATRNELSASSGHFVHAKTIKQVDIVEQKQPLTLAIGNAKFSLPTTTSSILYSLVETVKANDVVVHDYISTCMQHLAEQPDNYEPMLPWNI